MNIPVLSIIIPVYNAGSSIKTITSRILGQSFKDFELILIDDGSTDDTINVLRGIKKGDPRITILSKKNGGPSSARNMGLDRARGTYIMFLDADDDISPKIIKKMVGSIEASGSDVVISGWRIDIASGSKRTIGYRSFTPKGLTFGGTDKEIKTFVVRSIGDDGQLYNLWNKIFKAAIIKRNDLRFREDIKFGEDLIFSLQYFSHTRQLSLIPDVLYYYRANSTTSLFSKSALVPKYRQENLEQLYNFVGQDNSDELRDLVGWVAWRWLISYYILVGASDLSSKEKLMRIKQAPTDTLKVAPSARFIGLRKWCMELVVNGIRRAPRLALAFGWVASRLK